jgi:hypothetical protein
MHLSSTFLVLLGIFSCAHAGAGCCGTPCESNGDCAINLFCCPNHNECMGDDTKSTAGPDCDACGHSGVTLKRCGGASDDAGAAAGGPNATVLDGSYKGPCLITNCSGLPSSCVVGHYTSATVTFDGTPHTWGPPGDYTFHATYGDEICGGICYGDPFCDGHTGPPSCSMGTYPSTNHYVGEYCVRTIERATSTLDATLDNNAQTISGTMKRERQDAMTSSEYACSFSNLKKSTDV